MILRALSLTLVAALSLAGAGQDGKPLPDRATFLEETRKRLASDEQLQAGYTFSERRIKLRRADDGTYVPEETRVFEVYPSAVPDLTYRRLLMTDGVPTPARELAAEDRRQMEKVRDYVSRVRGESNRDRRRRLDKDEDQLEKERAMIQDVVSVLVFDLVRRETLGGRSAIVIAFAPRAGARASTREGRVVQHFKGLAWVDEEALQVVRAEAQAFETISFGLGLIARIHEGMRGEFVRRQVADGSWLPARAELTGTGRLLLFRKLQLAWINEYFDYRRVDPDHPPAFVALPGDVLPAPRLRLTPRMGGS